MPNWRCVWPNTHFKQGLNDFEKSLQNFRCRKVLLDFLFAETVTSFFQLLTNVGPVPCLWILKIQMLSGKVPHVLQIIFCKRPGPHGQISKKSDDLGRRVCHLGGDRNFSKVLIAQQCGFFPTKLQNFLNEFAIVQFGKLRISLIGCACDVGAVKLLTQIAANGKLHHWQVAGHFQGELVT